MIPPKDPDKARQDLADLLRVVEHDHNITTKLPNGATISWYQKPSLPVPELTSWQELADSAHVGPAHNYTQTFIPAERWYGLSLWPWYLRGPFSSRLRNWYARQHPEIFGRDY